MYESFDQFYPDKCCQGDQPPCACACPFHLDVRDFTGKYRRGSIDAAVKTYRNAVVFPRIVAELCSHPCTAHCTRGGIDDSIDLLELERAAVKYARSLDPINFNVPVKDKKIAVIGAGISGLACAFKLAAKKYQVTVFEKTDRIGGKLWELMDPEVFLADIATQGKYLTYETVLNREIKSLDELKDFDAIYIATGEGGNAFGLSADEDGNPQNGPKGVFIGGRVLGADTAWAIAQGAEAAINIEKHLMTGAMAFTPERSRTTRLHVYTEGVEPQPRTVGTDDGHYTKEEAIAEAKRCLRCDCSNCQNHCEFLQYYRYNPRQVANFTAFGLADMNLEPKSHNRMVNSCTDCGVCKEVCPYAIDNGSQLLAARREMFESKKIPPAYHYYWIRDMLHAAGEQAYLYFPVPEGHAAKYLFFPGCQLGASDPRYPKAAYDLLRQVEPDTAALITCCGAPAYWAGDATQHQEMLGKVREQWEKAGKPIVVCACQTCLRLFRHFLPELESISLYEVLGKAEQLKLPSYGQKEEYAVVDPCSAKFDEQARPSVCNLLDKMGVSYELLYDKIKEMPCCGFGGNIIGANPELAEMIRKNRVEADPRPYITYCANCRDIFAGEGKPAAHLIDLMAGLDDDGKREPPHISERRRNRVKARALFTNEEVIMEEPKIKLVYNDEIAARMDESLIFEEDIRQVIEYSERTGSKFIDDDGVSIGHLVIGLPTIWVEYRQVGENEYQVVNCYMHRMTIVEPDREEGIPQ